MFVVAIPTLEGLHCNCLIVSSTLHQSLVDYAKLPYSVQPILCGNIVHLASYTLSDRLAQLKVAGGYH